MPDIEHQRCQHFDPFYHSGGSCRSRAFRPRPPRYRYPLRSLEEAPPLPGCDNGNSLILQLRDGLGPNFADNKGKLNDYDVIMKTQQLSTTMRAIDETGKQIRYTLFGLMPPAPQDPTAIPAGLPDIAQTITNMIPEFQKLRQYGQTGRDLVAVIYGAISTCILPVLYALLGVCAKLLGQFEQQ